MKKTYNRPEALVMSLQTEGMIAGSITIDTSKSGNQQLSNDMDWNGGNSFWDAMDDETEE